MNTKFDGFTIIEVMLFLSITGLLLLGAFLASGRAVGQVRFTDGVRGLESFMKKQYEDVLSGVNSRSGNLRCSGSAILPGPGTSPPGTSSCYLLGKAIVFAAGSSEARTFYVVGSEPVIVDPDLSLNASLISYEPATVTAESETYSIPWDVYFRAGKRQDSQAVNAIAFLRSPVSSQVGAYLFNTTASVTNPVPLKTLLTVNASDTTGAFCVDGRDDPAQKAAIEFTRGQGSASLSALFDFPSGGAPC